jgi:transposase
MSDELTGVRKPIEPAFAEVQISEPLALPAPAVAPRSDSAIGIELPSGIRVTVDASVDADTLSRVIGVLTR